MVTFCLLSERQELIPRHAVPINITHRLPPLLIQHQHDELGHVRRVREHGGRVALAGDRGRVVRYVEDHGRGGHVRLQVRHAVEVEEEAVLHAGCLEVLDLLEFLLGAELGRYGCEQGFMSGYLG